jgi:hypothetical protein
MIARLVMAEAAPAVLPIWYSPKRISVSRIVGPIGRRIDGPITAATVGKRIGLEMKCGARDKRRERLFSYPQPIQ